MVSRPTAARGRARAAAPLDQEMGPGRLAARGIPRKIEDLRAARGPLDAHLLHGLAAPEREGERALALRHVARAALDLPALAARAHAHPGLGSGGVPVGARPPE